MGRVSIPWRSWVLVCDGAKALMFRNDGDAQLLNLKPIEVLVEPQPATSEIGTDRPGRVHESHGTARSAVETTDWHAEGEAAFLRQVAEAIDETVRLHSVTKLVVVAPPKALGVLRERFTPAVRAVVTAEIAKDLARLPTHEIEQHLAVAA